MAVEADGAVGGATIDGAARQSVGGGAASGTGPAAAPTDAGEKVNQSPAGDDAVYLARVRATTPGQIAAAREAKAVAAAMCQRYAPAAPVVILAEATLRCASYLLQVLPGAPRQRATGNNQVSIWIPRGSSPLRSSGAMALLSPYKVRRAL